MANPSLRGKTALVTGASSGMGADFARQLAQLGCHLILVARRADRLKELEMEIAGRYGVTAESIALDLAAPDAPRQLYDRIRAKDRTVDVLVNNAGFAVYGEFHSTDWKSCRQMLEIDIVALTHMTRLFAADMVQRKFGYILQVASNGAFQPTPLYAAYAAAKTYVLYFGEALHCELRPYGVGVTVLCPGVTRTEFFDVAKQEMNSYQRAMAMQSADVVRIGIRAMLRKRSCAVTGTANAIVAALAPLAPRQFLANMAKQLMR